MNSHRYRWTTPDDRHSFGRGTSVRNAALGPVVADPEVNSKPNANSMSAWAVHAFTATGVVLAFLATLAAVRDETGEALAWLAVALLVDGIDGSLARAADVKGRLPRVDGDALDLVIDYLTYVFIPALLLWRGDYFPPDVALPLVAAILISSLYVFARRDMKTDDGYFRGFPALWNVVVLYLFVTQPTPWLAAAASALLVILTFAPVHVVHPFRVKDYGLMLPVLAVIWAVATGALIVPLAEGTRSIRLAVSVAATVAILAMGLARTIRGPRPPRQ